MGLYHLHEKKILHRDLKTQNILLNSENDVKIADFGLAKQLIDGGDDVSCEGPAEKTGDNFEIENTTQVGTPFYLAPEMLSKDTPHPYSVKTDVWTLGIILYELCALKKPFLGNNQEEVYDRILTTKPQPIPYLSKEITLLLNKLLMKDPS